MRFASYTVPFPTFIGKLLATRIVYVHISGRDEKVTKVRRGHVSRGHTPLAAALRTSGLFHVTLTGQLARHHSSLSFGFLSRRCDAAEHMRGV